VGLAWLNLASGELRVTEIAPHLLENELRRIGPAEILAAEAPYCRFAVTRLPEWHFDFDAGRKILLKQLGAASLAGYGCEDLEPAIGAAGALLEYARKTQGQALAHVAAVIPERASEYVRMDAATRRNLELTETLRGSPPPRFFPCSMSARAEWGAGSCATGCTTLARSGSCRRAPRSGCGLADAYPGINKLLRRFADVERITGRIALKNARPRDLSSLRDSLASWPSSPPRFRAARRCSRGAERSGSPVECLALLRRAVLGNPRRWCATAA